MEKIKLFILCNSVWHADDYLNQRNCNPLCCEFFIFSTEEACRKKAMELDTDFEIYNDATMYVSELSENEISDNFEVEMSEFKKIVSETEDCSLSVDEVCGTIINDTSLYLYEEAIDAANYDFDKSLEGSILVFWEWRTYVGYARKCLEVRYADEDDTEAILTKQDHTFVSQCSVLLTAEEVRNAKKQKNLYLDVLDELQKGSWKWTNPSFAERQAEQFE